MSLSRVSSRRASPQPDAGPVSCPSGPGRTAPGATESTESPPLAYLDEHMVVAATGDDTASGLIRTSARSAQRLEVSALRSFPWVTTRALAAPIPLLTAGWAALPTAGEGAGQGPARPLARARFERTKIAKSPTETTGGPAFFRALVRSVAGDRTARRRGDRPVRCRAARPLPGPRRAGSRPAGSRGCEVGTRVSCPLAGRAGRLGRAPAPRQPAGARTGRPTRRARS